jgi:hypothetical protein
MLFVAVQYLAEAVSLEELLTSDLDKLHFFFNLHSGGFNQGPFDTAAI